MAEYLLQTISDHSPLRTQIAVPGNSGPKLWKVNPIWFNLFPPTDPLTMGIKSFLYYKGTMFLGVVWDGLKAHVRGLMIKQIFIKMATKEARKPEERYIKNPSPASERSWLAAQSLHQQVILTTAENKRFFTQRKYFEEGENTGHVLAVTARSQQGESHIETIQDSAGNKVRDVAQILDVFSIFFKELYASKVSPTEEELVQFVDQCTLPSLSTEGRRLLNEPITIEELTEAVAAMANSKSPGTDGLPAETMQ